MSNKITYRQQYTRCGKQRCRKCKEGSGHGPYWYAYWSENGRTISKYIGIHAPPEIEDSISEALISQALSREGNAEFVEKIGASSELAAPGGKDGLPGIDKDTQPLPVVRRPSGPLGISTPSLRIYLLGQFRVERRVGGEWQTVTNRTWHRRRARALLGCLLSNPGRRLGREQAMEALWPDLDIETAANRLNGAVHEVRQILEPEITRPAASRMLRLERDVLILGDSSQIWVDAEAFESLLNKANASADAEQAERLLEDAARLYGGDYLLEELYSEWAAPRRESLRRGWMGLLLKLAELRATRGSLSSAIEPLDRLLTTDPTHETAVRRLMIILTQLDRRGEALRAYQRLTEALARDYESDPLPETTHLYEALKQGTYQVQVARPGAVSPAPIKSETAQAYGSKKSDPNSSPGFQGFQRPFFQPGRHYQSKLVGRERELEVMQHFLSSLEQLQPLPIEVRHAPMPTQGESQKHHPHGGTKESKQKTPHFLLLMGESGIGKTRLAEELSFEASMRGWSVVWAHAYEQEGTIPYRPWTEILRTLLKDVPAEFLLASLESQFPNGGGEAPPGINTTPAIAQAKLARLSTLVPELVMGETSIASPPRSASSLSPEQERLHLWEATTALLSALSRVTPLLLVLDDLHWTDDSSLELLAYIVRHVRDEAIALVATCRDVELAPTSNLRTLINDLRREQAIVTPPILPLEDEQIGSMFAHLPQHIIKSIQTQAGGNPFFAEELARVSEAMVTSLTGEGLLENRGQPAPLLEKESVENRAQTMPETITAVLDRRLSKLSSECQALLGKVAVLGGSFEFGQLASIAGDQANEDTLLDLLEEALRAGLLTEEGTGPRILYHFWHPLIVSHLYERLSAARRAQLHRRAAQALIQLHQGNEAEAATITFHLSKGGGDPTLQAHYAEIAANRAYALPAYSEAERHYRIAIAALSDRTGISDDLLHLASLYERVAECCNVQGKFDEMRRLYTHVLDLRKARQEERENQLGPEDALRERQQEAQRQALIWREIGRAWSDTGANDKALTCYERGVQVMREAGVTSGAAWACLVLAHGNMHWRLGNYEEARRCGLEALTMLEQVLQRQTTSSPQLASGELLTNTARAMIGSPFDLGKCYELLGIISSSLGQYSESLKHLENALAIYQPLDEVRPLTLVYGNLGAVYATRAENAIARTYFQQALGMAERYNDLPYMAWICGNLGDVGARCGNLVEAEEWFQRSLSLAEYIHDREQLGWVHIAFASALQDRGNMYEALSHIRRGLVTGRAIKNTPIVGFALLALADWRIARAIEVYKIQLIDVNPDTAAQSFGCEKLLKSARYALQRALNLAQLEAEVEIEARLTLASAQFLLKEVEVAHRMALQSLREAREHGLIRVVARAQRLLGRILAAEGKHEEADANFEQALEAFAQHEMRLDYARSLNGYGVTLLQRGKQNSMLYQKGLAYLREARDLFYQCSAPIDAEWVERVLANTETLEMPRA